MKRKWIGAMTVGAILLMTSVPVFATFKDVDQAHWGWAKEAVEKMADQGIILGMPDGSFAPDKGVTSTQALLLISRILGINDANNKELVDQAETVYASELRNYKTTYKRDISFLLYMGVLNSDELNKYIGSSVDPIIKRYEAAILLTKAMGKEAEVKEKVMTVLDYNDGAEIPSDARSYVQYVKDANLMQGDGVKFSPLMDVNRAQMAAMLYRVVQNIEATKVKGILTSVDASSKNIKITDYTGKEKSYNLGDNTIYRMDVQASVLSAFTTGSDVILTLRAGKPYLLEGHVVQPGEVISGILSDFSPYTTPKKLTFKRDSNSSGQEYPLDANVIILYNGVSAEFSRLQLEDTAEFNIQNGVIKKITAESKIKNVTGIVDQIILTPTFKLAVKGNDGSIHNFDLRQDVAVRKNEKSTELKDIVPGDQVTLTLEYNMVSRIDSASIKATVKGTIEEIVISKNPSIKLSHENRVDSFSLVRGLDMQIDGKSAQVYDLRLGEMVTIYIESNTIVKMEVKSVEQTIQLTGKVTQIVAGYYLINLATVDAVTGTTGNQQIFVKKEANITDNSKASAKLAITDIQVGDTITAIGGNVNDVFEANIVVIIGHAQ